MSEANSGEIWKATEVGELLAAARNLQSNPSADAMLDGISTLVRNCDNGTGAAFSKRIGVAKSSVTHWLKERGIPAMSAHLRIASQCGVSVKELLTADTDRFSHPSEPTLQLSGLFETPNRKASAPIDRKKIDEKLDEFACLNVPISVQEAARRLNVTPRTLYDISNERARRAGARWKKHVGERSHQRRERIVNRMRKAIDDLCLKGESTSLRQVKKLIKNESGEKFYNANNFYHKAKSRILAE
ncbi:hypothetical protein [Paraburkholderia sp. SIMBA_027]|uniref:hypothetical protein n=1 Tax=Paraburkholderia sp. SIMBA_027 TaxID=3085770 RepID=UPI003979F1F9